MSFILDALKKSENERQRQHGPALFEVRVAPPRSRLPLWALLVGALLAVNLAVLAWVYLRSPGPAASAHPRSELAAAADVRTLHPPAAIAPAAAMPPPAVPSLAAAAQPPAVARNPLTGSAAGGLPPVAPAAGAEGSGPVLARDAAKNTPDNGVDPDDVAPAEAPKPSGNGNGGLDARGGRAQIEGLQTYADAAAVPGSGMPALRLDLHVFAAKTEDRFVLINMRRLREGEALPDGVRVESITNEGAVVSYHGTKYLLDRE